jgi:hypothetical protein
MPKKLNALVPCTLEVLEPKPTRVDTVSRYLLAAMALLALALATGAALGLVEVHGGLL